MRQASGRVSGRSRLPRVLLAGIAVTVMALLTVVSAALTGTASAAAGAGATAGRGAAGGGRATGSSVTAPDAGPARQQPTVVSLTFDDGDADQLGAARILRAHGLRGTFYIIAGAVGTPGYLSLDGLHQLRRDGMEIGGHTVSHLNLTRVSAAEARRQVCDSRDILARWGFRTASFAYPGAFYSPALESIIRGCGFSSARIASGLRSPGCPDCAVAETLPSASQYALRTPGQLDGSWTLAGLQRLVRQVQQQGGGWLPLVFHHICSTGRCPPLSVRASLLQQLATWLAQQRGSGVQVRTVGQVIGGTPRPLVSTPAAAPHGVVNASLESQGVSASVDPSLELRGAPGTFVSCWMPGSYGTSSEHWSRTRDARTSRWALTLTVTGYRSGGAELLQQFDTGQCSLPVAAGRSYQLSSYYRSTARTQYAVYYRNADGRWAYWTSSPYFPASGRWAHAGWRTPPVPAGAAGLSFGLAISSNGSLTTDGYRFSPAPPDFAGTALRWVLIADGAAAAAAIGWGLTRVLRRRRHGGAAGGDQATLPDPRRRSSSSSR